ncbi:MAG: hypothetical protein QUS33_08475 [Dehalococcoidia bacterium]|nr:hypothetical protein [Dehalococcoidia bacterium]
MNKRLIAAAVLGLLLLSTLAPSLVMASASTPSLLAGVDVNTDTATNTVISTRLAGTDATVESFNPEMSGGWGGEYGGGAVTAFPEDGDPAGYIRLEWAAGRARCIELRVLDGIADDSFDVYVRNRGGCWALVYSYSADPSTAEQWVTHYISSFPAGRGRSTTVEVRIEPVNVGWSGFDTWGQLAVDYVKIWGQGSGCIAPCRW